MRKRVVCLLMTLLLLLTFPVTAMAEDESQTSVQTTLPGEDEKYEAIKDLDGTSYDSQDLDFTTAAVLAEGDWQYFIDANDTAGDTSDDFAVTIGYIGTSTAVTTPLALGSCPVKVIDFDTFLENDFITSVTVSAGVKEIYGFNHCVALTSVTLPSSLEKIGYGCFWGAGLTSITIPASVSSIGLLAIDACPNMQAINVDPANSTYTSIDGVLFNKAGTTLIMYPKGKGLTSYTVSEGVQTIGTDAFYGAPLTQVTLPQSLMTIGVYAFQGCDLASVIIPSGVQNIGQESFSFNFNLKKVIVYSNNVMYDYDDIKNENPGVVFGYSDEAVLYGNAGSTTQSYASAYGIPFGTFTTSIRVSPSSARMVAGTLGMLDISTTPAGGYVTWSSNNESVATVDADGVISAKAVGTVIITATSLDKSASCTIYVEAPQPISISCTKTDATVYGTANGSVTVSASGGNSGYYEYSLNGGTNWQASNVFGGVAAGTYTAAVRDAYVTNNIATCSVTVNQPAYMGSVPAKKIASKVNAGNALTIVPPAPPKGYTVQSVTYSSSNPAIATVDAGGNVTFLAGGKVTIITKIVSQTVDKKGKVKTKTTTVKKSITVRQPVASISLNMTNTTIARTQKVKLGAAIAPGTASVKKLKWTSSNPKVAAVSSSGVVTGKAGGTAVITCTATDGSGKSASCTVNVTPIYPTGIKLSKGALTLKTGKTGSLKATIAPKNTDFKTVTWASSNPGVVTVDAKGKLRAVAPGTAVITATTSSGQTASCTVTVQ